MKNREGWGAKSAENLFKAISDRRAIPLNRLIFGLGIRHVGETSATLLARHYGSWTRFRDTLESAREHTGPDWDELNSIDGVGPIPAAALVDYFHEATARAAVDRLIAHLDIQDVTAPDTAGSPSRAKRSSSPARWSA